MKPLFLFGFCSRFNCAASTVPPAERRHRNHPHFGRASVHYQGGREEVVLSRQGREDSHPRYRQHWGTVHHSAFKLFSDVLRVCLSSLDFYCSCTINSIFIELLILPFFASWIIFFVMVMFLCFFQRFFFFFCLFVFCACSLVRPFVVGSSVCWFVLSFVRSFARFFVRTFLHFLYLFIFFRLVVFNCNFCFGA